MVRRGDFQEYLETAFENRPEMKVLEINILQTDQNIRLAKSGFYPEIALEFDYIKEGDDPDVSGSPFHDSSSWQAMAVASWNFWEWGKTHYPVKEKESLRRDGNMVLLFQQEFPEDDVSCFLASGDMRFDVAPVTVNKSGLRAGSTVSVATWQYTRAVYR